jgi:hypothetical protein
MKNIDSDRLPRQRNRKSDPPTKRFAVLSGIDDWEDEKSALEESCPPTLPSGEFPSQRW